MSITDRFRALHQKGNPFILANAWDIGSARMLAGMGAQALATSSAAHAFTVGRGDGGTLTRDEALSHAQDIVAATDLPVQGDFENGFGDDPDTCAETVRMAAEIGLAGLCIEDIALPSDTPYDADLAVERIRASAEAARRHNIVLAARADGIMLGAYDTEEAIRRLRAFEAAGAEVLYAPLPPTIEDQARIIKALEAPVNVLIAGPFAAHPISDFAKIGAARLSLGSSLARVTHQAILTAGRAMFAHGNFSPLSGGADGAEIGALLSAGRSATADV